MHGQAKLCMVKQSFAWSSGCRPVRPVPSSPTSPPHPVHPVQSVARRSMSHRQIGATECNEQALRRTCIWFFKAPVSVVGARLRLQSPPIRPPSPSCPGAHSTRTCNQTNIHHCVHSCWHHPQVKGDLATTIRLASVANGWEKHWDTNAGSNHAAGDFPSANRLPFKFSFWKIRNLLRASELLTGVP